jgi:hypothetical protein
MADERPYTDKGRFGQPLFDENMIESAMKVRSGVDQSSVKIECDGGAGEVGHSGGSLRIAGRGYLPLVCRPVQDGMKAWPIVTQ